MKKPDIKTIVLSYALKNCLEEEEVTKIFVKHNVLNVSFTVDNGIFYALVVYEDCGDLGEYLWRILTCLRTV